MSNELLELAERFYKLASTRLEVDLLPPPDMSGDDYFDVKYDSLQKVANFVPQLWASEYQEQFFSYLRGAVQRGEEEIKKKTGSIRNGKHNVVLTLMRVDSGVKLRGDYRYPSDEMAQYLLDTKYDLVPIIVGSGSMGNHLLDGHHRWRAYLMAGLKPLVLQINIEPSQSEVAKLVAVIHSSALDKK